MNQPDTDPCFVELTFTHLHVLRSPLADASQRKTEQGRPKRVLEWGTILSGVVREEGLAEGTTIPNLKEVRQQVPRMSPDDCQAQGCRQGPGPGLGLLAAVGRVRAGRQVESKGLTTSPGPGAVESV